MTRSKTVILVKVNMNGSWNIVGSEQKPPCTLAPLTPFIVTVWFPRKWFLHFRKPWYHWWSTSLLSYIRHYIWNPYECWRENSSLRTRAQVSIRVPCLLFMSNHKENRADKYMFKFIIKSNWNQSTSFWCFLLTFNTFNITFYKLTIWGQCFISVPPKNIRKPQVF